MKKICFLLLVSLYFTPSVFAQLLPKDNGKTYQNAQYLKKATVTPSTTIPVWNTGKGEWEAVTADSLMTSAVVASLLTTRNPSKKQFLVKSDSSEYQLINDSTYIIKECRGVSAPAESVTYNSGMQLGGKYISVTYKASEKTIWKNPLSPTGKTTDFTYQNNRWFPTKGHVTPQDYDAKADNITDDLLAFRAMLKSNYPIVIPHGSYKISDTLGISRQLDLVGSGVKITQTTADKGVFYAKVPNIRIYGFELVANFGTATTIYNAFAIISTNARNLKIESNIIHGFGGGGMWLPNAPNAIIRDNLIYDCSSSVLQGEATDIYMWVGSEGAQIINNRCFSNSSQGIYNISGGNEFIVSGNQCTPKDPITFNTMDTTLIKRRHGIVVSYGTGVVKNVSITNNIISNTNWTGIYFTGSDSTYNVLISGNVLSRNGLLAGNTLSGGIAVFSQPKSLLISNNTIDEYKNIDPLVGGITFQPGNISSTLSDSTSCTITSNVVRNSTRGLSLGNRATNVIVSNNTFKDFTKGGIDISTVTSTTFVGGYIISNNTFETVSRLGTTGMIKADLQASTKIVELYSNHFRTLGTIKDTGIVSNYWSKIKLVGNDFTNLTTACYSGGYISTSLNKDLNNTFKDCTNAYDISAASLGAGYYYYKNAYFENVTNIFTNTIGSRAVFDKLYNFQEINSGTTITQLESTTNLNIDGYSVLSSMAVTLKSAPVDGDVLTVIVGLGYTTAGNTAITGALTFTGGFIYGDVIPANVLSGSKVVLTYNQAVNRWNLKYSPYGLSSKTGSISNTSITIPTISALATGTATVTVTGASVGDKVHVSPRTELASGLSIAYAYVSAANTVKIGFTAATAFTTAAVSFDVTTIK